MQLNPELDPEAVAAAFAHTGRTRIPGVLTDPAAERLYACLEREVPWQLIYNQGNRVHALHQDRVRAMSPAERQALQRSVFAAARDGFQFLYHCYPMVREFEAGRDPGLLLHDLLRFLNSEPMLELVRAVTGIPEIVRCDAQATVYRPGHFLTLHDDLGPPEQHRRVAYVLNMSRNWRADWGGLLQFMGPDGDVEEAWVPAYNSLALFRVPTPHSVSCVAPFAGGGRYAVTGWWRDG